MTEDRNQNSQPDNPDQKPKKKNFWDEWRNAFSMKVAEDEFNESDKKMIDDIAEDIANRRMASPAIMFLVSIKPVTFIMSSGMQMLKPFMPHHEQETTGPEFAKRFMATSLITDPKAYARFALLMEKQEGVEKLISSLEKFEDIRLKREKKEKESKGK
jgi:hypothetical protein